jgi:hypothetical protein
MFFRVFLLIALMAKLLFAQSVIDITVKGISDGKNDGVQKDREEAVLDAKRQACEKAGVTIASKTDVKNFSVMSDYVETQSKAVLLPGFQIVDVGYVVDGTYQVVLTGKIKTRDDEDVSVKELRYAKTLEEKGEFGKCRSILAAYIDGKDEKTPDDVKEQACYYFLRWGFAFNASDEFDKFASYYPESEHLEVLKNFITFSKTPLFSCHKECSVDFVQWQNAQVTRDECRFDRKITVVDDTVIIKDYKGNEHSLLLEYTFLQSTAKDTKTLFAYLYSLRHRGGNIRKTGVSSDADTLSVVFEVFKTFAENSSLQFQAGRSDIRFGNFTLADYSLVGEVPARKGVYAQKLVFTILQNAF